MIKRPYMRWTQDTETAFLLALRQTGTAQAAAAAIGRCAGSAYKRRQREPEFRERWDAMVDAWQADWIAQRGAPPEETGPRERWDGWSAVRKRAFLRALSETGAITEAAQRVGISRSSVTRLKTKSPEFAAACAAALARSLPCLEQVAWERAVEGWDEEIVQGGKVTGTRRRYSETLLRTLLVREQAARQAERVVAAKARTVPDYAAPDETDAALLKALDRIAQGRRREAVVRADAWQEFERAVLAGERAGLVP
ncbi:hypothetical protein [Sphingomonas sp.]|jgi:hypothetical protein|uniref:hypothetical protein n=1 Tax=Sphingomonas sp. TaxID=28214 RepID=UPI002E148504|nr:hypothetical protein [Sphingomonas sp.]